MTKIGVFDSGVGGLTVLSELRYHFPKASYVYLGDTANVPYGTKSSVQIERLSRDCARTMKERGVDTLVVACNTASSLALGAIRDEMGSTPVLGVVRPGAEAALDALTRQPLAPSMSGAVRTILVLATTATVRSHAYAANLSELLKQNSQLYGQVEVIEQACPLLVPMIEEGWVDHPILHQTIQEYVRDYLKNKSSGIALLGCTHYPWIQKAVQRALPGWNVINSAQAIAAALGKAGLQSHAHPGVEWIFTDPLAVPAFARKWIESET